MISSHAPEIMKASKRTIATAAIHPGAVTCNDHGCTDELSDIARHGSRPDSRGASARFHQAPEPGVPVGVHESRNGSENEPFDTDRAVVLTTHERKRTGDEHSGDARQGAYRAISVVAS
jgi:hypothetical protein